MQKNNTMQVQQPVEKVQKNNIMQKNNYAKNIINYRKKIFIQ